MEEMFLAVAEARHPATAKRHISGRTHIFRLSERGPPCDDARGRSFGWAQDSERMSRADSIRNIYPTALYRAITQDDKEGSRSRRRGARAKHNCPISAALFSVRWIRDSLLFTASAYFMSSDGSTREVVESPEPPSESVFIAG